MNLTALQQVVNQFMEEKKMKSKPDVRILDLTSEVGELAKEVLKGTNYGQQSFQKTDEFEGELGDVLFSLICLANESECNLNECLNQVLNKYHHRFEKHGRIDSGE